MADLKAYCTSVSQSKCFSRLMFRMSCIKAGCNSSIACKCFRRLMFCISCIKAGCNSSIAFYKERTQCYPRSSN
uniref:Putative ovule protein n=1 Tax=Solanum chacoense TaxID=4108 RepID=A0A0V0HZ58_SOLCH